MHSVEITFDTNEQLQIFLSWFKSYGIDDLIAACEEEDIFIGRRNIEVW